MLLWLGGLWSGVRLLLDPPFNLPGFVDALLPLILMIASLTLAPLPWQWTRNDEPLAGTRIGLLQSIFWNGAWVILLLGGFWVLGITRPPPLPGPPRNNLEPWELRSDGPPPPRHPDHPPGFDEGGRRPPPPRDRPTHPAPPRPLGLPHGQELFHFGLGLLIATVLGRLIAEREAADAREAELRLQTEKAQAQALQSQMQPHALFNALSGLVELAREDPEATEEALVALCDYLRRLMSHGRSETAPLRVERELLQDYLRIEQIRLGERLRVEWVWPAWADELKLPPLLLQPLVENAVLHGIARAPEGGVLRIGIHRAAEFVHLKVDNTGRPPEGDREALGLGHLQSRLAFWGKGQARFELVREGDWTRARISLPMPS